MPETIVMKRNKDGEFVPDYVEDDEPVKRKENLSRKRRKERHYSPLQSFDPFIVPKGKRKPMRVVEAMEDLREGFAIGVEFVEDLQNFINNVKRNIRQ